MDFTPNFLRDKRQKQRNKRKYEAMSTRELQKYEAFLKKQEREQEPNINLNINTDLTDTPLAQESGDHINNIIDLQTGNTALHNAASQGDLELTEKLLQAGADVHSTNAEGMNALHLALNHPAVAKLLIEHHAVMNINSNEKLLTKIGQNIQPAAMRLFAAQTKKNKKYRFVATIIAESQLDECLDVLKSSKKTINEKVAILTPGDINHWYCSEMKTDQTKLQLLIVDSLGHETTKWEGYQAGFEYKVTEKFKGYTCDTYINKTKRQYEEYSCASFTLTDLKDLHKINNYLPSAYSRDLFKYCADKKNIKKKYALDNNGTLNYISLPLKMMRSTQSSTLLTTIIPSYSAQEKSLPINKKKQTALISAEENFMLPKATDTNKNPEKKINCRSKLKLEKTLTKTFTYLQNTPINEINETMEKFTISGLKKRLLKK